MAMLCRDLFKTALPEGLRIRENLRVWGTYDKPEKDGTIYDFIDGPGQIYMEHGFKKGCQQNLRTASLQIISTEIYEMAARDSALSLFADSRLRTDGEKPVVLGEKGVTYQPRPNYIIEFCRDRYYVRISAENDSLAGQADELANMLDGKIKELREGNR